MFDTTKEFTSLVSKNSILKIFTKMLIGVLLLGLASLTTTKNLGRHVKGHLGRGMTQQATECEFTYQIVAEATCDEIAKQNAMSTKAFAAMNDRNRFVDCTDGRNKIWPPVVVCIASAVFQDFDKNEAFNGTTGVKIALPGENSSNKPIFNGTFPSRNTTATTTATRTTASATVALPTESLAALPTDAPCVPTTTCAENQCGTVIKDNCGNDLTCEACPPPPPPPPPPPCNYDGTLGPCAYYAQSDSPPNMAGYDVATECLVLTNYPRQHYNPGTWDLTWNDALASAAYGSAEYSARNQCSHCHTNSGPGTSWGQNLYLGPCSCTDAYFGWITNEAAGNDPFNRDAGHFQNVVGFEVPYQSVGCASANVNGVCATVCNYGIYR
ncbi:hypothetical protein BDR26DRAFT_351970 [Obelidium mucronatum]|nr:hypothetical protein BDR26DRAFT_351970 [Obelidium mucronatum]